MRHPLCDRKLYIALFRNWFQHSVPHRPLFLEVNSYCKRSSRGSLYNKHLEDVFGRNGNQDEIAALEKMSFVDGVAKYAIILEQRGRRRGEGTFRGVIYSLPVAVETFQAASKVDPVCQI